MKSENYIGIGVALGSGIGTALGVVFKNIGMGIAIGVGVGTAIGAAIFITMNQKNKPDKDEEN